MCGIAGYTSKQTNMDIRSVIKAMTDIVSHRGPDGDGVYVNENVGIGHRRLSIIDLSNLGRQPMRDDQTRCVITYNGEIYNYIEIRQELNELGHVFMSNSDTEVVLKAYVQWGANCVTRFNGMWAFCIYDPNKNIFFCSRDRFGVKPFYYLKQGDTFAFGSEIRQLLPFIPRAVANKQVLFDFLIYRNAESYENTFFNGVMKLPGGHNLIYDISSGQTFVNRYYSLRMHANSTDSSLKEASENFRNLFEDSIRLRLRSDVRVGVCLSGGLDSSSIAALASRQYASKSQQPFSAITAISEDPATDESNFAKIVVDKANLNWIIKKPNYSDFCDVLLSTVRAQEEPFSGASIIMQHFVMRAARDAGIPVLLDGQGGDETLLGYERYFVNYCMCLVKNMQAGSIIKFITGLKKNGPAGAYKSFLKNFFYFNSAILRGLASPWKKTLFESRFMSVMVNKEHYGSIGSNIFDLQKQEIEQTNLPALLRYEDKNSMWYSIETRLPFLDYRLVEFSLALSPELKIHQGWTKYLLRRAMTQVLPDEIAWRKNKFGFEAPEARWMSQHRPVVYRELQESMLLKTICQLGALDDKFLDKLQGGILWRLYSTALWAREFDVTGVA